MTERSTASPARIWIRRLVPVLGTLLILALLLGSVEPEPLLEALAGTRLDLLAAAVGLGLMVRMGLMVDRWRRILDALGCRLGPGPAIRLGWASLPLQLGTPAKAGAVLLALYLERHHRLPAPEALSSQGLPRLHSLAVLAPLSLLGITQLAGAGLAPERSTSLAIQLGLACAAGLVGLGILLRWHRELVARVAGLSGLLARWLEGLLASLTLIPPQRQAGLFAYSATILLIELCGVWLLYRAVGVELDLLGFLPGIAIAVIAANIPIALGGFGTREAATLLIFGAFGSPESLLAAGLLWSFSLYLLPILLGLPAVPSVLRGLVAEGTKETPCEAS